MNDKLLDFSGKLPAGWNPSTDKSSSDFWAEAVNVEFRGKTIHATGKQDLVKFYGDAPVRGLASLRTVAGVQELYFGTLSKLYRSPALGALLEVGSGFTTQEFETPLQYAGHWKFANWGEWLLATNGKEPVQVRKGSGNFVTLQENGNAALPFTRARLIAKLGPHVVVANTNNAANEIRWCSDDNIEKWTVLDTNTAGDYVVRDADSDLMAMEPLGTVLAVYTRESMWTITYIGAPFVFGVNPAVDGIGAFGPSAVAAVGKYNYGWGPMGIWQTDGTSYTMIDGDIREYINSKLAVLEASQIVAFHDEVRRRVTFSFPTEVDNYNTETICYDYSVKAWSKDSTPISAALPRNVFQWPLVADTRLQSIHAVMHKGQLMYLETPLLHFGDVTAEKFVSQVRIEHKGEIQFQYSVGENSHGPFYTSPPVTLPTDMEFVGIDTGGKYWQFSISAAGDASISGLVIYGRSGGRRI